MGLLKKNETSGVEEIIELGKDTDQLTCDRLGGKKGSDGVCRLINAGVGEDGDVHIKVTRSSSIPHHDKK